MKIVRLEVCSFRGIQNLDWTPERGLNCLIGPGDSTKTTILDAIELALNPRSNFIAEETDLYNLNEKVCEASITLTLVGLPAEFCIDNRYGLHLRGWDEATTTVVDEPAAGLEDALSIRVTINPHTLEGRWSIYNDRLKLESDPPSLRYSDARELATTRLGPYAQRHLGWGRNSVLTRIGEGTKMSAQLAAASRAAREAFRKADKTPFEEATQRAETLGKHFAVAIRDKYAAELDIQGSVITSGGVTLHDGPLPLRTLGTGSSRLIVSALQHNAGGSHIALVDEIEHGLEPHRIARLLKYLRTPPIEGGGAPQVFMTSHSPVVIRELQAADIHAVRSENGTTKVRSVQRAVVSAQTAQRHLRASPEAFLARRVIVGEGRTECGVLRGLDSCWVASGKESFAYQGAVAVDGGGCPNALTFSIHLVNLGYEVLTLLDTDEPPPDAALDDLERRGAKVLLWPGGCSLEERIFLDVPRETVNQLLVCATERLGAQAVLDHVNAAVPAGTAKLISLALTEAVLTNELRGSLGRAATEKSWFKTIEYGERVGELIYPALTKIDDKPLAKVLVRTRLWIDA